MSNQTTAITSSDDAAAALWWSPSSTPPFDPLAVDQRVERPPARVGTAVLLLIGALIFVPIAWVAWAFGTAELGRIERGQRSSRHAGVITLCQIIGAFVTIFTGFAFVVIATRYL